jgi:hypothetical protein
MDTVVAPYTAISISILARFIFLYLLYKNKSRNLYTLTFCVLNIGSSGIWLSYGYNQKDTALMTRSATEITLLLTSVGYILWNTVRSRAPITQVSPITRGPPPPGPRAVVQL